MEPLPEKNPTPNVSNVSAVSPLSLRYGCPKSIPLSWKFSGLFRVSAGFSTTTAAVDFVVALLPSFVVSLTTENHSVIFIAASRTLHSPSATRLRQFVHDLIMDKMLDNQLDECGLTFADLALIEDAFLRVLATRFHSRIRYPGQDEEGPAENEKEAEPEAK